MRGFFGIGVYHPKTEINIGTLWRHAFLYNAGFIFTIGKRYERQHSDTTQAWRNIPLFHYSSFDDFYSKMPYNTRLVCIELAKEAKPLINFIHPERAIYLLGAEDYGLPETILQSHTSVYIPYPKPYSMNVAVAGSIIMHDRYMKTNI